MIIGEAPTADAQGFVRPFPPESPSGKRLQEWLDYLELKRNDVYVTNARKCPKERDGEPSPNEFAPCLPWLMREISQVAPKVIITLGGTAHKCFTAGYIPPEFDKFVKNLPSYQGPLFRVWDIYPSAGKWEEKDGILYFTLLHPASHFRRYPDNPLEGVRAALDQLRALLSKYIGDEGGHRTR